MIMDNVCPPIKHTEALYTFDLKGSSINRKVIKRGNLSKMPPTGGKVLKDLDLIAVADDKKFLVIDDEMVDKIHSEITTDIQFLKSCGFMDYSLLLSIK